ncbi:hypothetical protein LXA43DRAFT_463671 [Ganoderma leucocontextum]|nr:hypothetical protein LXA43DRAFT_430907 [Ganoderma leucocontextum]KAI1790852.1 hypothetical protein LXA43DRAFT_463671 [Ganoderma leucocontextum]
MTAPRSGSSTVACKFGFKPQSQNEKARLRSLANSPSHDYPKCPHFHPTTPFATSISSWPNETPFSTDRGLAKPPSFVSSSELTTPIGHRFTRPTADSTPEAVLPPPSILISPISPLSPNPRWRCRPRTPYSATSRESGQSAVSLWRACGECIPSFVSSTSSNP